MGRGAGLGTGQGEVVGDHVVQFPGDAHPFLDHPVARLLLTFAVGVLGTGHRVLAPHSDVSAKAANSRTQAAGLTMVRTSESRCEVRNSPVTTMQAAAVSPLFQAVAPARGHSSRTARPAGAISSGVRRYPRAPWPTVHTRVMAKTRGERLRRQGSTAQAAADSTTPGHRAADR